MSSFQEMLPTQAYVESQRTGSAGEGVSLGWLQGNPLKSGMSDKRLVLEGGGCTNTAPTKAGICLIQADAIPISKATFPLISDAALDFSAWKGSRFIFSKGYRTMAGIPSLRRKQAPSSSRQCPSEGIRGDNVTQNLWARADFVEKNLPIPNGAPLSSYIWVFTNPLSREPPAPSHTRVATFPKSVSPSRLQQSLSRVY